MSKIFSLREWFYLEDACEQLSQRFNEPVTVRDLLALALDKRLTLSMRFRDGIDVRAATLTNEEPTGAFQEDYIMTGADDRIFLSLSKTVSFVGGLFDLPMLGGEQNYISEFEWQGNTEGEHFGVAFDEVILRSQSGQLYVLVEPKKNPERVRPWDSWQNYHFSYSLPATARPVMRLKAMLDLESSLQPQSDEKQLNTRERTNLLNVIGALLELNGTKEAAIIGELLERYPDKPGIKKRTLEAKFAEAKRSLIGT